MKCTEYVHLNLMFYCEAREIVLKLTRETNREICKRKHK